MKRTSSGVIALNMAKCKNIAPIVNRHPPLFSFKFWQEEGDEAIFAAAWEMVELAEGTSMAENPNYKELLEILNECEVEYFICRCLRHEISEPRYTKECGNSSV